MDDTAQRSPAGLTRMRLRPEEARVSRGSQRLPSKCAGPPRPCMRGPWTAGDAGGTMPPDLDTPCPGPGQQERPVTTGDEVLDLLRDIGPGLQRESDGKGVRQTKAFGKQRHSASNGIRQATAFGKQQDSALQQ